MRSVWDKTITTLPAVTASKSSSQTSKKQTKRLVSTSGGGGASSSAKRQAAAALSSEAKRQTYKSSKGAAAAVTAAAAASTGPIIVPHGRPQKIQTSAVDGMICHVCHYSCEQRAKLMLHFEKAHMRKSSDNLDFECAHCDYATPLKVVLKSHLITNHAKR